MIGLFALDMEVSVEMFLNLSDFAALLLGDKCTQAEIMRSLVYLSICSLLVYGTAGRLFLLVHIFSMVGKIWSATAKPTYNIG